LIKLNYMNFSQYRDTLIAEKYAPIPGDVLNQMVIEGRDLDRVANSCQRLIIKAMSKLMSFKHHPDSILFEYVQVCNAALAEAINDYNHDKVDFSFFAYIAFQNAIKNYYRANHIIKPRKINGEKHIPQYSYIDEVISDHNDEEMVFDLESEFVQPEAFEIDLEKIYATINQKLNRKHFDIYIEKMGLDGKGGGNFREIAEKHGITAEMVRHIKRKVEDRIKTNPDVMRYLQEFL